MNDGLLNDFEVGMSSDGYGHSIVKVYQPKKV